MSEEKPRRRWFQPRYSLAMLFAVVTVFGVWLGVQVKWIKDRREFAQRSDIAIYNSKILRRAPGMLWAFGEIGVYGVLVPQGCGEELVAECKGLFPEAEIATIEVPDTKVMSRPRKKVLSRPASATQP